MTGRAGESRGLRRCHWTGGNVELALDNSLDSIEASLPELERFIDTHGLDPLVANRLEVIFEELVSNAIRHGFTPGSPQSVRVVLLAAPDHLELTFEDDGRPFNPLEQAAPRAFGSLETTTLGGLGIPLVRKMSASLRYERPSDAAGGGQDKAFRPQNRVVVTVAR